MAKDRYHYIVKRALIKDDWHITHDPYYLRNWDPDWEVDLAGEKVIGAERNSTKIAVEVKCFLEASFAHEFHKVLGQYMNYHGAMSQLEQERELYVAVPISAWETDFQRRGVQFSLHLYKPKLIIFNPETETIEQWILF